MNYIWPNLGDFKACAKADTNETKVVFRNIKWNKRMPSDRQQEKSAYLSKNINLFTFMFLIHTFVKWISKLLK